MNRDVKLTLLLIVLLLQGHSSCVGDNPRDLPLDYHHSNDYSSILRLQPPSDSGYRWKDVRHSMERFRSYQDRILSHQSPRVLYASLEAELGLRKSALPFPI